MMPRRGCEVIQNGLKAPDRMQLSMHNDDGGIDILKDQRRHVIDQRVVQPPITLDHPLEHVLYEQE